MFFCGGNQLSQTQSLVNTNKLSYRAVGQKSGVDGLNLTGLNQDVGRLCSIPYDSSTFERPPPFHDHDHFSLQSWQRQTRTFTQCVTATFLILICLLLPLQPLPSPLTTPNIFITVAVTMSHHLKIGPVDCW